jgi:hypothetical protein
MANLIMTKALKLKARVDLGVVPTHCKFIGAIVPDDQGHLPRNEAGQLVLAEGVRRLAEASPVQLNSIQMSLFSGTREKDLQELMQCLQELDLTLHIIMMVGGGCPMDPANEDAVVSNMIESISYCKAHGIERIASTSLEDWMNSEGPREGADFEKAVAQLVKVHARAYREGGIEGSCIKTWDIEFLRSIEFKTFTTIRKSWAAIRAMNQEIGKTFFRVLVDAAHCGDSDLSIDENISTIREIAAAGEMGMFHASAKTTRGCLSTDDGWIGALLAACAETGELTQVMVELFHHQDEALGALRDAVAGHGVDTLDGRSYDETVIDGIVNVTRRLNNYVARGMMDGK